MVKEMKEEIALKLLDIKAVSLSRENHSVMHQAS
jgi:hypothetical protein